MGITAAGVATAATIAGGIAAVGGTAYELTKGSPKTPAAPTLPATPPSASPATLATAATSGAMQQNKSKAAGAAAGFDGTLLSNPLGQSSPSTAKSSLLGA